MRFCTITIACLGLAALLSSVANGAYPTSISIQGKLTDASGTPLPAGVKSMTFRIFANSSGGTQLWPDNLNEAQSISSDANGLWTAYVGAIQHLSPGVFSDTLRWLEISVDGTILPRVRIVTSPSALQVASVDGALGGAITTALRVGTSNSVSGDGSLASGGGNSAIRNYSAVCGGFSNNVTMEGSGALGGGFNGVTGEYAAVIGGFSSHAIASYSAILGGYTNETRAQSACVAGGTNNTVTSIESFIGGGTFNIDSGSYSGILGGAYNTASGTKAAVVGGAANRAQGQNSCIAGAISAVTTGDESFVGGGYGNAAYGNKSVALGGESNVATGNNSLAAGKYAYANNQGSFVWSDGTASTSTNADGSFLVRASGGVTFISNAASTAGVWLFAGSSGWSAISDSTAKEHRLPVDGGLILERLAAIPIDSWNYKAQDPSIRHIGAMAQDFHSAFGVGESDRLINTIDADGVALAAIKELYKRNQDLEAKVERLQARIEQIENKARVSPK